MQKLIRMEFWKALDGTSQLYGGDKAQPPLDVMNERRLHHVQVSSAMGGEDVKGVLIRRTALHGFHTPADHVSGGHDCRMGGAIPRRAGQRAPHRWVWRAAHVYKMGKSMAKSV